MRSKKLGERMIMARQTRGKMTQDELAQKITALRHQEYTVKPPTGSIVSQTTISRWEQGRQKISPGNIHMMARALDLAYEEEIYWLGLAGHLASTPVPTKEQIIPILNIYSKEIQRHPFPALIVDYRNNLWAINAPAAIFVGSYEVAAEYLEKQMMNLFDIFFSVELGFGSEVEGIAESREHQIMLFLITNLHRRHEPFLQSYPECWKHHLSDYNEFKRLWNKVCQTYLDSFVSPEGLIQRAVDVNYVQFQTYTGIPVGFKVMAESYNYFNNNFFQVLYYVLDNDEDKQEAANLFKDFQGKDASKLNQWELRDVDEILASYT
jgi:transcriptional regulator with XRE-family HTH domain